MQTEIAGYCEHQSPYPSSYGPNNPHTVNQTQKRDRLTSSSLHYINDWSQIVHLVSMQKLDKILNMSAVVFTLVAIVPIYPCAVLSSRALLHFVNVSQFGYVAEGDVVADRLKPAVFSFPYIQIAVPPQVDTDRGLTDIGVRHIRSWSWLTLPDDIHFICAVTSFFSHGDGWRVVSPVWCHHLTRRTSQFLVYTPGRFLPSFELDRPFDHTCAFHGMFIPTECRTGLTEGVHGVVILFQTLPIHFDVF